MTVLYAIAIFVGLPAFMALILWLFLTNRWPWERKP